MLAPLFVVAGASGSGKTAVLAPLARRLRGRCTAFDGGLLMDPTGALSSSQPINWGAFVSAKTCLHGHDVVIGHRHRGSVGPAQRVEYQEVSEGLVKTTASGSRPELQDASGIPVAP